MPERQLGRQAASATCGLTRGTRQGRSGARCRHFGHLPEPGSSTPAQNRRQASCRTSPKGWTPIRRCWAERSTRGAAGPWARPRRRRRHHTTDLPRIEDFGSPFFPAGGAGEDAACGDQNAGGTGPRCDRLVVFFRPTIGASRPRARGSGRRPRDPVRPRRSWSNPVIFWTRIGTRGFTFNYRQRQPAAARKS